MRIALLLALPLLAGALGVDLAGQWRTGLRPAESGYGAVVYTVIGLQGLLVATAAVMVLYTLARSLCGMLDAERRVTFDNRSEEHTSELQSLMRISYAVFCSQKKRTLKHSQI